MHKSRYALDAAAIMTLTLEVQVSSDVAEQPAAWIRVSS
jgi:hypothetical protein